ncbi:uncharacterized protein LOC110108729 [Dendrobium catenatum]|uniref:SMP-30/Gluconolactonase/LRE-like region domain-containing protein n=1 Tax=Dendrobium catenatum TaxID=906689 RepID=A0A2I0WUY0_9ASPA|nr:uncharacterized protein LOC110108729 [Dendrobium catenatum]PKU79433.1 hypothetical protein MA16_Dca000778 [Dendrobium catenatum]
MFPSFFSLFIFLLSSISIPALASHRHIISIPSTVLRPASFAWDPAAQHFVVGYSSGPIISSISDAGVAETIVSDELISSVSSIFVDNRRRRLLVAIRNPNTLTAYDLRSPRPHRRIFSSSLAASPGGIGLDPATGFVFVTGSDTGVIWRVDLEGIVTDFSRSAIYGDEGLVGVAHVRKGFLLVVQEKTGRVFKVDEENGAAKEVIGRNGTPALEAQGVAMMADGTAVIAGGRGVRMLQSRDGWAEAAITGEVKVGEVKKFKAVTVRDGKRAYVLVTPEKEEEGDNLRSRIEEVEWEEEGDLLWLMVLVGFGLAYFLYWRFQMRQLVSNMNKKRA